MVDLARTLFILGAVVASVRARYAGGVLVALACALILGIETFFVLRFPAQSSNLEIALGAVFIGPTAMLHAPPFAASKLLMDPSHHLASAVLAALGAHRALARASALPPDGDASRRLDRAGLRFIALAVLAGLLTISGLMGHVLGGDE